jgi:hypothetical protein
MGMDLKYALDEAGETILVDKTGFQVMMAWEKPYMEALVDRLEPHGDVLEIGFGLGYSADQIQRYPIRSHTIIEMDPIVADKAREWAKQQTRPVHIVEGLWQTQLSQLGDFDCAFFDDAPVLGTNMHPVGRLIDFFGQMIQGHARVGCRITWYTVAPPWFTAHPATEFSCRIFDISIPDHCSYVPDQIKANKKVFLPLLTYPYGSLTPEQISWYVPVEY